MEKLTKEEKLNRAFLLLENKIWNIEQKLLRDKGIRISRREMIYVIFIKDMKDKPMFEIASKMNISKGAFSNTTKLLVQKKVIKKERSISDSRLITLSLDKQGEEIYKIHQIARKEIHAIIKLEINQEEKELLFKIGDKILNYINERE